MVRNRAVRYLSGCFAVVVMLGAVWGGTAGAQESLGVFPSFLEIPDALRGSSFSRTIAVQNFDADRATTISIEVNGDLVDWVEFTDVETGSEDLRTFDLAPNAGREVSVEFSVPDDVPNGEFQGQVIVQSFSGEEGEGVGVGLTVAVQATISVTGDEVRDASLQGVRVEPAEVGIDQRFLATVGNAGNVRVQPQVDVTITRDDDVIAEISSGEEFFRVEPGEAADAYVDWETSEVAAGDYTATFEVYDVANRDPILIGESTTEFRLEPTGALTRSADFFDFVLVNTPEVGGEAVIEGRVSNTGQLEIQAVLDAEVTVDGGPARVLTSLPQRLGPGGSTALELRVPVEVDGEYTVTALVNYDGVETELLELSFTPANTTQDDVPQAGVAVGEGDASSDDDGLPWLLIGGIAAAVAVLGAGAFMFSRRQPATTGRHAG